MRILQINTVYGEGSTGKIARDLHDLCLENGIQCLTACRYLPKGAESLQDCIEISTRFDGRIHGFLARLTMLKGCFSYFKTKAFIRWAKKYAPDLIHLHNLHGSYVNLPLLFKYIKKQKIPVVWTLHDCWPFTGICSHFAMAGCNRWQIGCGDCPQRKKLSSCPFDFSAKMLRLKKKWFSGVENLTLVTPSLWLAELVKGSFLSQYPVKVLNNGIDLKAFCPTPSSFREKQELKDKKIVLGVAFAWGKSKGLDVFAGLSKRLSADYAIVLAGVDESIKGLLPPEIVTLPKTNSLKELAEIYTAADVFVNPTREDTFPTVNIESLACGTPVITFKTGGSPEMLDKSCGAVVEQEDIDALTEEIKNACEKQIYKAEDCVKRSALYDKGLCLDKYIDLYKGHK